MTEEQVRTPVATVASDIAKDFLLQEHQLLSSLQGEAKAAGDARLNFYVTFTTAEARDKRDLQALDEFATQLQKSQ